ncbi:MAG: hypothetical protein JXB85_00960 [Anaerolineales bacterium]|nr:hypothetical protein [Anaerolineales bacterium]
MNAGSLIATILRHDRKVASYKIALIRSINDVVLGFPHVGQGAAAIAIPLRILARFWVAYYWPFVDPQQAILQGQQARGREDISFRPALTNLRQEWEKLVGVSHPSDGYFLVGEFLSAIHMRAYPGPLVDAFHQAIRAITVAIQKPIRYAGPDQYGVFAPPRKWDQIQQTEPAAACLPETRPEDMCVLVDAELWTSFCELSLWIEALCIHQWCLFTESLAGVERGLVYGLLTDRPDNRRPLSWERNQVDILIMEGHLFTCPWTGKKLSATSYDLDHILPLSVYPINEIWNLVPADRQFNQHVKRDRLPGAERLSAATPRLQHTYVQYMLSPGLSAALIQDSRLRFGGQVSGDELPALLTHSITDYLQVIASARNLQVF